MNNWIVSDKETMFDIDQITSYRSRIYQIASADKLQELASDIEVSGQLKPVFVTSINGVLFLIDGECRRRAMQMLGLNQIKGKLVEIEESEIDFFQVSANLYRTKSTIEVIEEVLAIKKKINRHQGRKIAIEPLTEEKKPAIKSAVVDSANTPQILLPTDPCQTITNVNDCATKLLPQHTPKASSQISTAESKPPQIKASTPTQQAIAIAGAEISPRTIDKVERIKRVEEKYPESKLYDSIKKGELSIDKAEKLAAEIEKRNSKRQEAKITPILRPPIKTNSYKIFNKSNWEMSEIQDNSLDLTFTSPPYWQQIMYTDKNEMGQEETVEEYLTNMMKTFSQVYRKTKKTGNLFVNLKGTNRLLTSLNIEQWFVIRMAELGWYLRDTLIWSKKNAGKLSGNRERTPENSYEPIFWFVKSADYHYRPIPKSIPEDPIDITLKTVTRIDKNGASTYDKTFVSREFEYFTNVIKETDFLDVITNSSSSSTNALLSKYYGAHPAPFPTSLPLLPLLQFCPDNGHVLDCFMGRGAGLVAALMLGHTCYGYEIDPMHYATAEKLLADINNNITSCKEQMNSIRITFDNKFREAA